MTGLERLSLNTATIKGATLAEAVDVAVAAGIPALGLWRDRVAEHGLDAAARLVQDAGLRVSSLCRGGFLTAADEPGIAAALADNREAIREAAALGTDALVLVVGGLPANPGPGAAPSTQGPTATGGRDVVAARQRVADRIGEMAPFAREHGVRLVLEPLHPMFAADRAVLSTLGQCLDLAEGFAPDEVTVVVDTYHVWWDPQLREQVARAGAAGRIASYQVCDFNLPMAADPLLSRGFMGDGYVDFAAITRWVAQADYAGDVEVEIFNQEIWDADPATTAATVAERYLALVAPHL